MTSCHHQNLVLLPRQSRRVRCRHCHLTIDINELRHRYCPECFEMHHKKRYDFEAVEALDAETTRYRCEDCGVIIDCDPPEV